MQERLSPPRAGRREWVGLAVLALPCLLISMDLTVLNLAIPALSADLQPTSSQLLWIVDIYGFLIAGSLITMGTLGDRIGRRRLLLIGGAAFGLTSLLAAFSTSAEMLIAARALLGVAGATLMPSTMSLIRNMFLDNRQRSLAIGVWVSSFSVGAAIGPLVGGALLEYFWWGSVFLLAVPVMVMLLILGPILLPEFRNPGAGRLDFVSAGMSVTAVLAVIYGVKQLASHGLDRTPIVAIVAGLAIGLLFIRRQRVLADPLIELRLFRIRSFSASLTTNFLSVMAAFGTFFFIGQYLQLVLGLSPLEAGIWSAPSAVASFLGSLTAPLIVRRVRPAYVIGAGLTLAAVAFGIISQVGADSLALMVTGSVLMMIGFSPVFTLTTDMIVTAAPPERAGSASAISETAIEFGGALGVAVLGSVGVAVYRHEMGQSLPAGLSPETSAAAQDTLGAAVAVSSDLPASIGTALLDTAREAFLQALHLAATIGIAFALLTALLALIVLRHESAHGGPSSDNAPEPEPCVTGPLDATAHAGIGSD